MKRKDDWRFRIEAELSIIRGEDRRAAGFFCRVVEELWRLPATRRSFASPFDAYRHLTGAIAFYGAAFLVPEALGPYPGPGRDLARTVISMRGELREALAWLRARPEWIDALDRHQHLVADDRSFGPAVRDLVLMARDAPGARDIDRLPAGVQEALEEGDAEDEYFRRNWREVLRRDAVSEWGSPVPWVEAVADELWPDPRVRRHWSHISALANFLLAAIGVAWSELVLFEDEDEDLDDLDDLDDLESLEDDLEDLEDLESLEDDLEDLEDDLEDLESLEAKAVLLDVVEYLAEQPFVLRAMERHAPLLPEGYLRECVAALRVAAGDGR